LILKSVIGFIIYSNLWIALAAASLCLPFYALNDLWPGKFVFGFVFTSTFFIYTWQRFAKIKTGQHFASERKMWMLEHRLFVNISLWVSGLAAGALVLFLKLNTLLILIPAGILSVFYVGRFLLQKIPGFRDLPFLKAYVVSLAWTAMLVFLPLFQTEINWEREHLLYAIAMFFFIFSLAVIFDMRDVEIDDPDMKTIPHLIGKNGAIVVALIALFGSLILMIFVKPDWIIFYGIIALFVTVLMLLSKKRTDDFFYSFWLDGFLFLPSVILFVINYL
jgi:hypothetical protein